MQARDFFTITHEDDGFGGEILTVNTDMLEQLRKGLLPGTPDLAVAQVLTGLVRDNFEAYGTNGRTEIAEDAHIALALKALRATLRRIGAEFEEPPFRDYKSFQAHWKRNGMANSWQARRDCLAQIFDPLVVKLERLEEQEFEQTLAMPVSPHSKLGWLKVDEEIAHLRRAFGMAAAAQQYSNIGNGCVRILEALGDMVYDPAKHVRQGEQPLSRDKTKARFDRFIENVVPGESNAELRKLVRAAVELAHSQKHRQSPSRRDAGIIADAVILLANMLRRLTESQ